MARQQSGSRGGEAGGRQPAPAGGTQEGGERPFLQKPQGVLAVVGGAVSVVVSVAGLVFLFADWQPEPDPPGIELVDFDLDKERNIQADWTNDGEKGVKDWKSSLVTVMLRNGGDNPVLVKHAEFRFSSVTDLGCPYGAGGSVVQARYDIKVPADANAPFTHTRKMKCTVPPHRQEQVAFTVGPESVYEGSLPQVYTFKITLHLEDEARH